MVSDHAPVSLNWEIGLKRSRSYGWWLNNLLLATSDVVNKVTQEIKNFLQWNKGSTSVRVVWDAQQAYIRGILINIKTYREKQRYQVGKQLEEIIKQLEQEQKLKITIQGTYKLQELRGDLKIVEAQIIAKDILYAKQRAFECRDKPGRQLAQILANTGSSKGSSPLRMGVGELTNSQHKSKGFCAILAGLI